MHAYHDILPGFDPDQIWYDGCQECESRSTTIYRGIGTLDSNNYRRAKARAIEWNTNHQHDLNISRAEAPLLETLWAIHCQEERAYL